MEIRGVLSPEMQQQCLNSTINLSLKTNHKFKIFEGFCLYMKKGVFLQGEIIFFRTCLSPKYVDIDSDAPITRYDKHETIKCLCGEEI